MSELEDIGRYHQLRDQIDAALRDRNGALVKVVGLTKNASESPTSRYNIGRRYKADAVQRLVEEAAQHDETLRRLLVEIEPYALIAGKPVPTLE